MLLQSVALVSDVDSMEDADDRVTLLTLHSAKGLEFPTVVITGVEEMILPHSRSIDDLEALAEERRLFYVGLTRARKRVHLVHTFRRTVFGTQDLRQPSRFLGDLPDELVRREGDTAVHAPRQRRSVEWPSARTSTAASFSDGAIGDDDSGLTGRPTPEFASGDRVKHAHFGTGVVVDSRVRDADEEVTVAFPEVGVKRLMQGFARLVKVAATDPKDVE
jgi:DNA helicase-2/ATP-dependent DNA helicase PcrA